MTDAPQEALPPEMLPFITMVSMQKIMFIPTARKQGEFLLGRAKGTMTKRISDRGEVTGWWIKAVAPTIAEAQDLFEQMAAGQIHPVVYYDSEMVPPPMIHLRQRVKELVAIIRRDVGTWWYRKVNRARTPAA